MRRQEALSSALRVLAHALRVATCHENEMRQRRWPERRNGVGGPTSSQYTKSFALNCFSVYIVAANSTDQNQISEDGMMLHANSHFEERVIQEIRQTPEEYLPNLLEIVRLFRESVTMKAAEVSYQEGMAEALSGNTRSIADLLEGIDAE